MRYSKSFPMRRFLKEESGQTVAVLLVTIFGVLGLSLSGIETGHIYYAYRLLQASTNAATLAAAQAMPNIGTSSDSMTAGTAWGNLKRYSSITNGLNATNLLTNVAISASDVSFTCSSTVASSLSVSCQSPTGTGSACTGSYSTCNTITVTQNAQVNLWFAGLLGISSMNVSAKAEASMRGGTNIPYNIAVIIDTTNSMSSCATTSHGQNLCTVDCPNGATSQVACAVQGLQVMLQNMDPCALNTTCSASTSYVDSVSLFVFPAIEEYTNSSGKTASYASDDTTCPTRNPPIVPYSFENWTGTGSTSTLSLPAPTSTYIPSNAGTYQVVTWDNTYKQSDTATTLNGSDPLGLPVAVGVPGSRTCPGLEAPGGEGTYYAQVIYAAQAALTAQQILYPGSQNVLIILSDGDATSCNTQISIGVSVYGGSGCGGDQILADNCPTLTSASTSAAPCPTPYSGQPLNGTSYSYTTGSGRNTVTHQVQPSGYQSPDYPSALGMCGQAVQAAQTATAAGTTVYTVAMGAETSGGCLTDQTYTISSLTNGAVSWPSAGKQPCQAIGAMASTANTFYSDDTNGCAATNNASFTTMTSIFTAIGNGLTAARLVPNGT
jgi:hypothetical protein